MFHRAGEKIKLLAGLATALSIVFFVGLGIYQIYQEFQVIGIHFWTMDSLITFGMLVIRMICNCFFCWIIGILVYGFGIIVDSHEGKLD